MNESTEVSHWFESEIKYFGNGTAVFSKQSLSFEGPAKATFDSNGRCTIDLEIEARSTKEGSKLLMGQANKISPILNCDSLVIQTDKGDLIASGFIHVNELQLNPFSDPGAKKAERFSFRATQAKFVSGLKRTRRYWVMPLVNFLVDFMYQFPDLANHPLRLRTQAIGKNAGEVEKQTFGGIGVNNVGVFKLLDGIGFIDLLPNYYDIKASLKKAHKLSLITGCAVGDYQNVTNEFAASDDWSPVDLSLLLSLATGHQVTIPWIEFRDDAGELLERHHMQSINDGFEDGIPLIDELRNPSAYGHLISKAVAADFFGKPEFRPVLVNLVRTYSDNLTIDEIFSRLCRVAELLTKMSDVQTEDLTAALSPSLSSSVVDAIEKCIDQFKQLSPTNTVEQESINKIQNKVLSATKKPQRFGTAIGLLLEKINLKDKIAIDAGTRANPIWGTDAWSDALNTLRNQVTHDGCLKLDEPYSIKCISDIVFHFQDLLTRIVLKMLGYEGKYIHCQIERSLDWVTENTLLAELAFRV